MHEKNYEKRARLAGALFAVAERVLRRSAEGRETSIAAVVALAVVVVLAVDLAAVDLAFAACAADVVGWCVAERVRRTAAGCSTSIAAVVTLAVVALAVTDALAVDLAVVALAVAVALAVDLAEVGFAVDVDFADDVVLAPRVGAAVRLADVVATACNSESRGRVIRRVEALRVSHGTGVCTSVWYRPSPSRWEKYSTMALGGCNFIKSSRTVMSRKGKMRMCSR